jgi:ketosteroid isomerase-like protein
MPSFHGLLDGGHMTESDVIARSRVEFLDAFNRDDVEGLAGLLTDDHVGMPPNRPAIVGKEGSRAYRQQGIAVAQSHFSISSFKV